MMPNVPSSILWDLDGTLIDSEPGILASCRVALRALGHEANASLDIRAIIGPPMDDVMRLLLAPYQDTRVSEAVAAYRRHYGDRGLFESRAYPGIAEALRAMRETGALLYLATSKRTVFARRILDHLELAGCFSGIHGSEPGGGLDEKSELIAHILKLQGLRSEQCLMVGDRRYDISGAHANRMRAIGVLRGYGSRDELEAAGADQLVGTPEDLANAASAMSNSQIG
jgi:phosphoglycolate phosphatase